MIMLRNSIIIKSVF